MYTSGETVCDNGIIIKVFVYLVGAMAAERMVNVSKIDFYAIVNDPKRHTSFSSGSAPAPAYKHRLCFLSLQPFVKIVNAINLESKLYLEFQLQVRFRFQFQFQFQFQQT